MQQVVNAVDEQGQQGSKVTVTQKLQWPDNDKLTNNDNVFKHKLLKTT